MAISQERYVEIVSGVAGATAIGMQKLVCRVFSNHPSLEPNKLYSLRNYPEVQMFFGEDSEEAKFASLYFNYVSPPPASKAQELQFFLHSNDYRPAQLVGGEVIEDIEELKAVNGNIYVSINNSGQEEYEVDFKDAKSYSDAAHMLSSATNLNIRYEINQAGRGQFVVFGDFTSLSLSGAPAEAVGLDNGRYVEGKVAQTLAQSIAESTSFDSFGSVVFLTQNNISEIEKAAALVASYNVRYQFYIDVPIGQERIYSERFIGTASTGLIFSRGNVYLSALPAAIMAATNYDRRNATVNYMFRSPQIALPDQVVSDLEANELDKLRINFYGLTQANGSKISFFQRGFLCGPASAPLDMSVHANEQWLKALLTQEWFTLVTAQGRVPANRDGEAMGKMVLEGVIDKALFNGVIIRGKDITTNQQIAIGEMTGDYDAWREVQDKGYWSEVKILEHTGEAGIQEYKMEYTLIYAKGDSVRKIVGSHNLI